MKAVLLAILLVGLLVPTIAAQDAPGAACNPPGQERASGGAAAAPTGVVVEAGNQFLIVHWVAASSVAGYRIVVFEDARVVEVRETSGTECRFVATNGRDYAILVTSIGQDGMLGQDAPPVAARPERANDLAYLTGGLLIVWGGLWGYVLLLVRQQRRIVERYEALLNEPKSGAGP